MYVLTMAVSRSCFDNNAMQFVVCFCRLLSDLSPLVVELHLSTTGAVQALCIVHIYSACGWQRVHLPLQGVTGQSCYHLLPFLCVAEV